MNLSLNLLVLRCADIQLSKAFYERLGCLFVKEKHGNGLEHYAACLGSSLVIELYPATEKSPVDHCRLGFSISHLADVAHAFGKTIEERSGQTFFLLKDPDDRTVELIQKELIG